MDSLGFDSDSDLFSLDRLWKWVRQHPGSLVVGAALLAALLASRPRTTAPPSADTDAEETPLFI
ncbi:MAG TPA: hypothetical protein VGW33_12800 [Terriglobia bacterium]|nr:hypothetical protein [Terriglobia bacterium]